MKTRFKLSIVFFSVLIFLSGFGLAGCGGGSGSSDGGEVVIGLTDAAGDFNSYTVDVTSVKLKKADGTLVETVPLATKVDFAQCADMTEFLTARTVPAGIYTEMSMTLDYTDADIQVEDNDGNSVQATSIVDEDGNTITTLTIEVVFPDRDRLVVAPGIPAHLTLDFDLASSNRVELTGEGPSVIVLPVLSAEINPKAPKPHRLRGLIDDVSVDEGTFTIIIRPFYHRLIHDKIRFGLMTVNTNEKTVYDIDGMSYAGKAGLEALSELDPLTGAVVMGDLVFADGTPHFEASEVRVGTSIPGRAMDTVTGNVIALNPDENSVTIRGALFVKKGTSGIPHITINSDILVTLDKNTVIRREMSTEALTLSDIGVGQRLTVFGSVTSEQNGVPKEMDASGEYVIIKYSTIKGSVKSVDPVSGTDTPLVIDLKSVDNRPVDVFDFTGTGIDPHDLCIDPGTLDISGIKTNGIVKIRGFFTPADTTSHFEAKTIVDVTEARATLMVTWKPASDTAFTTVDETGITLDLANVGKFHYISRGWVVSSLEDLDAVPVIAPAENGAGRFCILQPSGIFSGNAPVRFYNTYADFASALNAVLKDGGAVRQILARGRFDDASATMTADVIEVHLTQPFHT